MSTGVWGSDAPTVVSVTPAGVATALASGIATVYVDYGGTRGAKLMTVLPKYQGNWLGSYSVTGCTESGSYFQGICAANFPNSRVYPLTFQFTQDWNTLQGTTLLGSIVFPTFSTPITSNGSVVIITSTTSGSVSFNAVWNLQITQAGKITGTLNETIRSDVYSGEVRVSSSLFNVNLASGIVLSQSIDTPVNSLADLLEAIRR